MGSEEFLNQIVKALGIIIEKYPRRKLRKRENWTMEKIGCIPIYLIWS